MRFALEKAGSALVLACSPRAGRRGQEPMLAVANWRCACGSTTIRGKNMRADGDTGRTAEALCSECQRKAGTLVVTDVPKGLLKVSG